MTKCVIGNGFETRGVLRSFLTFALRSLTAHNLWRHYAPINVKPLGGRRGIGGGFDVTSLPVAGNLIIR